MHSGELGGCLSCYQASDSFVDYRYSLSGFYEVQSEYALDHICKGLKLHKTMKCVLAT